MTIHAFKQRLSIYPDDALCCGTFWLADDFLALDNTLDDDSIVARPQETPDSRCILK
ncbi:hypothetical protein [Serratia fonticola]